MPKRICALRVVEDQHPTLPHADRTKRRKAGYGPSTRVFKRIAARDGLTCSICRASENLTIDHDIPISRGGTNEDGNLQLLCNSCNSKKRDYTTEEYLAKKATVDAMQPIMANLLPASKRLRTLMTHWVLATKQERMVFLRMVLASEDGRQP